uniref:Uncharacterized protein n=1 Tax=Oryza sativa subsp. japonica TaxID=39947 RepID=Q6EP43_ORYSJ|nr:hypothetical protein [Oryza sativa Japonica Group]BAD29577.1 hypothetical protein [Oryza sativa Japonica Group]
MSVRSRDVGSGDSALVIRWARIVTAASRIYPSTLFGGTHLSAALIMACWVGVVEKVGDPRWRRTT